MGWLECPFIGEDGRLSMARWVRRHLASLLVARTLHLVATRSRSVDRLDWRAEDGKRWDVLKANIRLQALMHLPILKVVI